MVVLDKRTSGLSYKEDFLPTRFLKAPIFEVGDAKSAFCWSDLARLSKKLEHVSALDHTLNNSIVACIRPSRVGSQEIREKHVTHDLRYAYIDETYAIIFFELSRVAQHTRHLSCERCFESHIRKRYSNRLAQFDWLSWRNELASNMKHVTHT